MAPTCGARPTTAAASRPRYRSGRASRARRQLSAALAPTSSRRADSKFATDKYSCRRVPGVDSSGALMAAKLIDLSFTLQRPQGQGSGCPRHHVLFAAAERGCASVRCACETTNCGLCTVWLDGGQFLRLLRFPARARREPLHHHARGPQGRVERLPVRWLPSAEQCGFYCPRPYHERAGACRAARRPASSPREGSVSLPGNLCRCSTTRPAALSCASSTSPACRLAARCPLAVNDTSSDGVSTKQITHKQPKKDSRPTSRVVRSTPAIWCPPAPDRQAQAQPLCPRQDPLHRRLAPLRCRASWASTYEDVPKRRFTIAGQAITAESLRPPDSRNLVRYQNEEAITSPPRPRRLPTRRSNSWSRL